MAEQKVTIFEFQYDAEKDETLRLALEGTLSELTKHYFKLLEAGAKAGGEYVVSTKPSSLKELVESLNGAEANLADGAEPMAIYSDEK